MGRGSAVPARKAARAAPTSPLSGQEEAQTPRSGGGAAIPTPGRVVRPQPGPQEAFLRSSADIAIYGGAAGGGKTYALLLQPLLHAHLPAFGAVFFRRSYPDMTAVGSVWDQSHALYPGVRWPAWPQAAPVARDMDWCFPSGAVVQFRHMELERTKYDWKGAQVPLFLWDELTEFSETQFFYLYSRNRDGRGCGVRPYMRGATNPDADSWLVTDSAGTWGRGLISWWIDSETGIPIPERSGKLRWFVRKDDELHWGDDAAALGKEHGIGPTSVTFIPASLADNAILVAQDPGYRDRLMALPFVERERLLGSNWKIKPAAGLVFNEAWFEIVEAVPTDIVAWVRYWDKAGTEGGGKFSAGVKIGLSARGFVVVADVVRGQWGAYHREQAIRNTAKLDGPLTEVWVEMEPGSGGKESAENTVRSLIGYTARVDKVTGSKLVRAGPFSAYAQAGNVKVLSAPWTRAWLRELHAFAGDGKGFSDQVDASSGAFNKLAGAVVDQGDLEAEMYGDGGPTEAALARELGGGERFVGSEGEEWQRDFWSPRGQRMP